MNDVNGDWYFTLGLPIWYFSALKTVFLFCHFHINFG